MYSTQSCTNRPEEFINLTQVKIDSSRFAVCIYSKTISDSSILYTDTIIGKIPSGDNLKTQWFKDSVICIVPDYIEMKTLKTPTNLKVVLRHGN